MAESQGAMELAPRIRVNGVAPGVIVTPFHERSTLATATPAAADMPAKAAHRSSRATHAAVHVPDHQVGWWFVDSASTDAASSHREQP